MIFVCSNTGGDPVVCLARIFKNADQSEEIYWFSDHRYRELAGKGFFYILWMRIGMYCIYPVHLLWKGLIAKNNSIFIATSNTFYAPALLLLSTAFKKHKIFHLLYDLYPDAIEVAKPGKDSYIYRQFIAICAYNIKYILKKSYATIYLGNYLKAHVEKRWGKANRSAVIDVGVDISQFPKAILKKHSNGKLLIRYGGQLGYMHDAHLLAKCCLQAGHRFAGKIEFHFFASGKGFQVVRYMLEGRTGIHLSEPMQDKYWQNSMLDYQVGLVSLSPGGATVCLPNKTYGMLAASQAVLAICPRWSDLGKIVIGHEAGWVINNSAHENPLRFSDHEYLSEVRKPRKEEETISDFEQAIAEILANPEVVDEKRNNARKAAETSYDMTVLQNKWMELLGDS